MNTNKTQKIERYKDDKDGARGCAACRSGCELNIARLRDSEASGFWDGTQT